MLCWVRAPVSRAPPEPRAHPGGDGRCNGHCSHFLWRALVGSEGFFWGCPPFLRFCHSRQPPLSPVFLSAYDDGITAMKGLLMHATTARRVHELFVERFNSQDADGVIELYEPNAVILPPGAPEVGGVGSCSHSGSARRNSRAEGKDGEYNCSRDRAAGYRNIVFSLDS
jgi:hypothetical protein